jgi:leader peptidase (prepilin peptidase)/N-methyltransferase
LLAGLAATVLLEPAEIADHALGAALGATAFFLIAACYRWARGRDGLGGGDAKLLGVAGAWLGSAALPWVVLIAALAGIALALGQSLRGQKLERTMRLPFGPCLALAIWLLRLYGEPVFDWLG